MTDATPDQPTATEAPDGAPPSAPTPPPALRLLLDVDESAAATLAKVELVATHAPKRPVVRRLRQVFWDTPGLTIGRQGIGFAIETIGRRRQQLLRPIGAAPTGGRILTPITAPLDGERLDPARLAFLPGVDVGQVARLLPGDLVPARSRSASSNWRCRRGPPRASMNSRPSCIAACRSGWRPTMPCSRPIAWSRARIGGGSNQASLRHSTPI